ncbi:hypothetical protein [Homoserinimonas sp. OAct 916]|uniref:hypothetical protein n=1 Tax=Homoserinimonas sp. OAct 916 TaxID=2211450 RepID=UPI000DBE369D|nr:hypothetical protein [Homoserinimonas sp. OAct 916]
MEILRNVLLVLHFIGLAAIIGGVMTQMSKFKTGTARVVPAIMHGAWLQLISGVALVGIIEAADLGDINNMKIGVKLLILVVITVLAFLNRKKDRVASWIVPTIGLLALADVVIAVFW